MYTNIISVQIIISLLKQYNIHHLVLSPGTRDTPFVHSVEMDSFFECYSIVDERSAAYFALGLSKAINEPVVITCTSATATCNYLPAIKEAYEQGVKIIALTSDRNYRNLYQMEDQMINQINMYGKYCCSSINLPEVKEDDDIWFCEQSINKALLKQEEESKPIQINIQISNIGNFLVKDLPVYRKINRINKKQLEENSEFYQEILSEKKRILVLCGENYTLSRDLVNLLKIFIEKYNAIVSYDHFSNITDKAFFRTVSITEAMEDIEFEDYLPDLVITIGLHSWSFIKYKLRNKKQFFEHWRINIDGEVIDGLKALKNIFKCTPEEFFEIIVKDVKSKNDNKYYQKWDKRLKEVKYPDLGFTNFSVIRDFSKIIPDNSLLHLSILNSIRLTNFFDLKKNIKCFANIGADGIDGSLSTYMGQSRVTDNLSFLVIGDLSFLYDLNGSLIPMKSNQRILVINNFSGGEFHNNFGLDYISTLNKHIAAGHNTKISDWVDMMDVEYMSASNQQELNDKLKIFVDRNRNKAILLEVFTDADIDAKTLKSFYNINKKRSKRIFIKKVNRKIKRIIKRIS